MTAENIPHPPIVSQGQWLADRKELLDHEKESTAHLDRVNAGRRRLPMVTIEKDYIFDGPNGNQILHALFDGRRQLIVYHFMFDPAWDKGCPKLHGLDNYDFHVTLDAKVAPTEYTYRNEAETEAKKGRPVKDGR